MRLINKYPNRRLYDTSASCYITLEDIRSLVLSGRQFVVRERRSQADITRSTLLQVLTLGEEAPNSRPVLDAGFLIKAIQVQSSSVGQTLDSLFEAQESLEPRRDAPQVTGGDRALPAIQSQLTGDEVALSN